MFGKRKHQRKQQAGCMFLFTTGLVIILLLLLNTFFVRIFFSVNLSGIDERIFQAAQFVLPIIMIFIEFWLYDLVTFRRKAQREKKEE